MSIAASELVHSSVVAEPVAIPVRAPKARDSTIDVLRGLAIIGVVYVHGSWLLVNGTTPLIPSDWFRYDVGSFIAIAAYLTCCSTSARSLGYWPAVGKRLSRLWLPFVVWSLLYFACFADWRILTPTKVLTRHFLGYGWAGQYYFLVLFQLAFLQPLFKYLRMPVRSVIAIYVASAVGLALLHCRIPGSGFALALAERPVIYWAPFVALGIWLARNREVFEQRFARVPNSVIAVVCLLVSCAPLIQDHFFPHDRVTETLIHLRSSNLLGSTAFFLGAWLLARRGAFGRLEWILEILGRYVLGIFCLNPLAILVIGWAAATSGVVHAIPYWLGPWMSLVSVPLALLLSLGGAIAVEALGGRRLVK
jgi:fucose 4-O-acetylase-like acetyltransferase